MNTGPGLDFISLMAVACLFAEPGIASLQPQRGRSRDTAASHEHSLNLACDSSFSTSGSVGRTDIPWLVAATTAVLTVTTSALTSGTVNAAYSQSLAATGGTPPYSNWVLSTGTLPAGITLSTSGVLSGTPTKAGSSVIKVKVIDSANASATSGSLTLNIAAVLTISTASTLTAGKVNAAYKQTLTATGGTSPYSGWTISSGTLPQGVTLSSAGVLSGTPILAGSYNFTVGVSDQAGASASASFQLTIAPGKLAISTPSSLPPGQVNAAYLQSLAAIGGTPPYTTWTITTGAPPPGLTLDPSGNLAGSPTTAGSYTFTAQVTDSASASASTPFQLTIGPAALAIAVGSVLPLAQGNIAYSQTMAATGGTPPYTWAIASGTLPQGLTLSSAGILSGTPTLWGTYSFKVQVTDHAKASTSASFQLTVNPGTLAITTTSPLPAGQVNATYSQTMAATGGKPPYTWAANNRGGLSFSQDGIWSGTPSAPVTLNITIQVADSAGTTATGVFQLTITPASPVTITTASPLPAGNVNTNYSMSMAANNGTPPYVNWTVIAGMLPSGLSLSPAGSLSGTPTTAGISSFTVQVTDTGNVTASAPFQLTINPAKLAITTSSSLPAGRMNSNYSQSLAASGGTPPYTWMATGVTPGLTLSSGGVLSGTPTAAGTSGFTVQVTDTSGVTASAAFQLTISPAPVSITTTSLPAGQVGTAYSQTLTASGGTPPYTWSTANSVPGLTCSSSGVLSGTPTSAGTSNLNVQVTDKAGLVSSTSLQLTINPGTVAITTSSPLPAGKVNTSYSLAVTATGGTPPYGSWTISNGALPPGLTLNAAGMLNGTPTSVGSYTFTIQLTDNAGATTSNVFQLTINPASLAISTASPLPPGKVNAAYSLTLAASGGTLPYTSWSTSNGTLPAGLTLGSAGVLSGTPTTAGSYNFTVQVTDSASASASASFQLTIKPAALTITTASPLPVANINTAYSLTLAASGGTPPYSNWTTSSGMLPPGLALSPAGVLIGTPTSAGTYSFTVQVTDSTGTSASAPFQSTINQATINQALPTVVAVVSSANSVPGLPVTASSWVALYGTNLAPVGDSRMWNSATEILNGKLPTSLDGTSVTVNGKAATVEYISPGQVNIQMPDDTAIGPVPVVVTTTSGGASSSFTVSYAPFSPGFFPATAPYIAAQHADNSYVTASAPALPGEVIILWGGGMGPASPAVPAEQVFVGASPLANTVTVTIGGQPAVLDFAGVVGAGLVQINAHVPAGIGSGDQAVVASVGGVSSPSGAYISVGTPPATSQMGTPTSMADRLNHVAITNVVAVTPAIVPVTPLYAGTDNGIYKSLDGGASWQPSLPSPGTMSSIHSIVVDPLHPSRIYAAGVNGSGGDTFFTSLDAGRTWSSTSAPPAAALALDPTSTNVLYLLAFLGGGLYKSEDSGQTWTPTQLENVTAIAADPSVTGVIFAGTSTGQSPLLKSYDFGVTWTPVAPNLNPDTSASLIGGISALAIDPHNNHTVYAVSPGAGCFAGSAIPCGVSRSTDSGNTWETLNLGDLPTPFVAYLIKSSDGAEIVDVATEFTDPGNSNNLYVLPKWLSVSEHSNGMFRSTDGGASWKFSPILPSPGQVLSLGIRTN